MCITLYIFTQLFYKTGSGGKDVVSMGSHNELSSIPSLANMQYEVDTVPAAHHQEKFNRHAFSVFFVVF